MTNSMDAPPAWSRRSFFHQSALAFAAMHAALPRDSAAAARSDFDWKNPASSMRTLARMYSTLEPGKLGWLYFFGRGVGTTGPSDFTPLFRLESVAVSRATMQPSGAVRLQAGQLILFLDWASGEVLEEWKNPYTGEVCEVFHYRDHPVDYEIDLARAAERYKDPTAPDSGQTRVEWRFQGDTAYGDSFVKTRIKNKLDPKVWKRESIGEWWETFEHYQWQARIDEITNPNLPQIPSFRGDFQTFKPFEPWMMMGQRPGKVFQQKTAMNIRDLGEIPRNVADYIEKHLARYLDVSNVPKDIYKLNDQHYMEQRKPR